MISSSGGEHVASTCARHRRVSCKVVTQVFSCSLKPATNGAVALCDHSNGLFRLCSLQTQDYFPLSNTVDSIIID